MLFFQKPKGPVSWLVVGLGNTGDRYEGKIGRASCRERV